MYARVKMWVGVLKKSKDTSRSHKRWGVMEMGSGDERGSLGGRGVNQKQTCVLMRCYLISDWYKTLSNWPAPWERWLPGTAVTGSDLCWCVPCIINDLFENVGPCHGALSCQREREMTAGLQKSSYQAESACHYLFSITKLTPYQKRKSPKKSSNYSYLE